MALTGRSDDADGGSSKHDRQVSSDVGCGMSPRRRAAAAAAAAGMVGS